MSRRPYGRPRLPITNAQIREAWASNDKLEAIAARLGCCVGTICYRAKRLRLPLRHPERGRRLSEKRRAAIVADIGTGTDAAIAAKHGVHEATVAKIRRKISGKKRNVYAWNVAQLRIACEQNMTLAEIAEAAKKSPDTVRHALKRFGLNYRRLGNAKPINREAFIRDWRNNVTYKEMARRHGFSSSSAVRGRIEREMRRGRAVAS